MPIRVASDPPAGRLWFTGRALLLHLTVATVVPTCVLAAYWQLGRALGGNTLSYAYMLEWPAFAGLAVWAWWALVHLPLGAAPSGPAPTGTPAAFTTTVASSTATRTQMLLDRRRADPAGSRQAAGPRLEAYNRYLAEIQGASPAQVRRLPRPRGGGRD